MKKIILSVCIMVSLLTAGNMTAMKERIYKEAHEGALKGDANAQFALGGIYYHGMLAKRDYLEAIKWYTKAAEQGHTKAQFNLGYIYFDGRGVKKNHDKALKWFLKAAKQHDAKSEIYVGRIYEEKQDYTNAFKWYSQIANSGYPKVQYKLWQMYRDGKGVKKDLQKAIYYLIKSTSQSYPDAQHDLGKLYLSGNGVEKDEIEGQKLLDLARKNGYKE